MLTELRSFSLVAALLAATAAQAGTLSFTTSASGARVLNYEAPASAGLNAGVYVADGVTGVTATYTASSPGSPVTWYRFSNLGGGYAQPVTSIVRNGADVTLTTVEPDMGYIIEEGTERTYFWVVDYSRHALSLDALVMGADSDCEFTSLALSGNASPITYYSINGRQMTLSRDMSLAYNTLTWNEQSEQYVREETSETIDDSDGTIKVPAPLCATSFTLAGDRFLTVWGRKQTVTSPSYDPIAVAAHTSASQLNEASDNLIGGASADALGGSAPAEIEFNAAVTDAAIFTEWQFSSYNDFEDIQLRVSDPVFTHTFDELGTTYVRFVCDNADGTCQFNGDVYQINIGESSLLCPNAFSPGASEGVNDEWKVSYKSIVSFECHIFNRWGEKMCSLSDPSQGWDGKYRGKLVPAGVYYYTIKARGADGRKYNLSGDINIIDYK